MTPADVLAVTVGVVLLAGLLGGLSSNRRRERAVSVTERLAYLDTPTPAEPDPFAREAAHEFNPMSVGAIEAAFADPPPIDRRAIELAAKLAARRQAAAESPHSRPDQG